MFNKKSKLIEQYKKCILINNKYQTIEGVLKFHQEFLTAKKVLPSDYWECLISYYYNELKNPKLDESSKTTYEMLYQELIQNRENYQQYFFNQEQLKKLEKKLSSSEKQIAINEVQENIKKENKIKR